MELPQPDSTTRAISAQLQSLIAEEIARCGGIGFDRYMELCLYAPGLGYYMAGSRKFGPEGDFITAPELSPLFSQSLAGQCAEAFQALHHPNILEFGAGCGVMAADILKSLDQRDCLPDRYWILEISPELRQRQQRHIEQLPAHLASRVEWLTTLPNAFCGIVLANEVLDAMPSPRFVSRGDQCEELTVCFDGNRFKWSSRATPSWMNKAHADLTQQGHAFNTGYTSELHPRQSAWLRTLSDHLDQAVVLLIDYGHDQKTYYHPERTDGTLQCHYRQRTHNDPFFWPGLQDLTVHINFTSLAQTAQTSGLDLLGYTTQGNFLLGAGITQLAEHNQNDDPMDLAQQIKRLTLPTGMGEQFKVMALSKECHVQLSGFQLRDLRHQL